MNEKQSADYGASWPPTPEGLRLAAIEGWAIDALGDNVPPRLADALWSRIPPERPLVDHDAGEAAHWLALLRAVQSFDQANGSDLPLTLLTEIDRSLARATPPGEGER